MKSDSELTYHKIFIRKYVIQIIASLYNGLLARPLFCRERLVKTIYFLFCDNSLLIFSFANFNTFRISLYVVVCKLL